MKCEKHHYQMSNLTSVKKKINVLLSKASDPDDVADLNNALLQVEQAEETLSGVSSLLEIIQRNLP